MTNKEYKMNKALKDTFTHIFLNRENYLLTIYSSYQCFKNFKLSDDIKWICGKHWGQRIYEYLNICSHSNCEFQEPNERFVYSEKTLCNALGVACGYGINEPVFVNITDSVVTSGLFYESLIFIKEYKPKINVLIDFNSKTRNNENFISLNQLKKLLNTFKIKYKICKPYEKIEINNINEPYFYIFKTKKYFKHPKLKYLNTYNYKTLSEIDYKNLIDYIDEEIENA